MDYVQFSVGTVVRPIREFDLVAACHGAYEPVMVGPSDVAVVRELGPDMVKLMFGHLLAFPDDLGGATTEVYCHHADVATGLTWDDVEPDAKAGWLNKDQRRKTAVLQEKGFTVGMRDPRLNTAFRGVFMVVQQHDESELPTESGCDGPWCIVGDNLGELVDTAYSCFGEE